jgi:hypothetical protein
LLEEVCYPPHLHHLQQGGVANNYVNTNGNEEGQSVAYEDEQVDADT